MKGLQGSLEGSSFSLEGRLIIGRDGDADIQLLDKGVSRQHACIFVRDDGTIMLIDLSSRNGTYISGDPISQAVLRAGDRFRVGDSIFELSDSAPKGDEQIRLSSGVALEPTATNAKAPVGLCTDPLHVQALTENWRFCPSCGNSVGS